MKMVSRIEFRTRFDIEARLFNYGGIFAIDSDLYSDLTYCISDGKFAILRQDGALFCLQHETPLLARELRPEIGAEVMEIYREYMV